MKPSPGISARHRARLLVLAARTRNYLGEVEEAGRVAATALAVASAGAAVVAAGAAVAGAWALAAAGVSPIAARAIAHPVSFIVTPIDRLQRKARRWTAGRNWWAL